ncbi:MAG: CPBP family intramembrane metalloprotease [Spirochaetales bacterium]|nr:CPBP family intramembrane metalloprotease [Spirochaetales bacterium]
MIEAPIVEEILFRGIFFVTLIRIHRFWGYISSNILFVLWHISFSKLFGDGIWTISPTYSLSLFISGLFASVLYEKTGDIKVPIVFHFCLNLIPKSAQLISYHFGLF